MTRAAQVIVQPLALFVFKDYSCLALPQVESCFHSSVATPILHSSIAIAMREHRECRQLAQAVGTLQDVIKMHHRCGSYMPEVVAAFYVSRVCLFTPVVLTHRVFVASSQAIPFSFSQCSSFDARDRPHTVASTTSPFFNVLMSPARPSNKSLQQESTAALSPCGVHVLDLPCKQMLRALDLLFSADLLHGDIKLDNWLVKHRACGGDREAVLSSSKR